MTPDLINGLFEVGGAITVSMSIRNLLKDKHWAGLSIWQVAFFQIWGCWNLFFYPTLDQMYSFYGGIVLVAANTTYVALLIYYPRK